MKILLTLLLCLSSITTQASEWGSWPVVGSATLRWGPFDVYFSVLRTPTGRYEVESWPLALSINYQRNIDSKDLVQATKEQLQELKTTVPDVQQQRWLEQLAAIWPDVQPGSQLTFVGDSTGGRFYYRQQLNQPVLPLGERFDDVFRDAFLAIWLSPETQYPDLRHQLIGGLR